MAVKKSRKPSGSQKLKLDAKFYTRNEKGVTFCNRRYLKRVGLRGGAFPHKTGSFECSPPEIEEVIQPVAYYRKHVNRVIFFCTARLCH